MVLGQFSDMCGPMVIYKGYGSTAIHATDILLQQDVYKTDGWTDGRNLDTNETMTMNSTFTLNLIFVYL